MISLHTQLLIGLVLYLALSPVTTAAFADFGAAMKDSATRLILVEHVTVNKTRKPSPMPRSLKTCGY
ncbi:MAG: hypothetical protein RLZZ197_1867 [Bacteroidota bacterium]